MAAARAFRSRSFTPLPASGRGATHSHPPANFGFLPPIATLSRIATGPVLQRRSENAQQSEIATSRPIELSNSLQEFENQVTNTLQSKATQPSGGAGDDCPDFCGGDKSAWIPDHPFKYDFSVPCANHDFCYDEAKASRLECDDRFKRDMMMVCAESTRPVRCAKIANIYYRGVRRFGGSHYASSGKNGQAGAQLDVPVPASDGGK